MGDQNQRVLRAKIARRELLLKESVAAAAQFIKTHAKDVGLPNDWQDNYDIAVLATMMGVPKEGPSAGISITTGIGRSSGSALSA